MNKKLIIISTVILFITFFIVAASLFNEQKDNALNDAALKKFDNLQRDYSPTFGPKNAKVTIVEFFDPACGTCGAFYPLVKQMMKENKGKVNLVVRYLPLHSGSDAVVSMLEATRKQNLFWEALELAYKTQNVWVVNHTAMPGKFWMQLSTIGIDMKQLEKDVQSEEIIRRIRQDMQDAKQLQVSKTPGFFVNGKPLIRFGHQQLKQLVDAEVSKND